MSVMWYLIRVWCGILVLTCISLMTTTLLVIFPRCYTHCSISSPRVYNIYCCLSGKKKNLIFSYCLIVFKALSHLLSHLIPVKTLWNRAEIVVFILWMKKLIIVERFVPSHTVDKRSSSPLNLHPYLFPCPPVVLPCWRTSCFMFKMTQSFSLPYSCRPNKSQVYDSWLLPYLILPAMYWQFFHASLLAVQLSFIFE